MWLQFFQNIIHSLHQLYNKFKALAVKRDTTQIHRLLSPFIFDIWFYIYIKQGTDLRTYFKKSSFHHSFNTNYFHMSALTKHCLIIQAHRSFFGTFLLFLTEGGERKGCQKAFTVVQCLAHGTTAGDRESNRFGFGASRYWPPIHWERSISDSINNYYNSKSHESR